MKSPCVLLAVPVFFRHWISQFLANLAAYGHAVIGFFGS
jgi:hypothetical protein